MQYLSIAQLLLIAVALNVNCSAQDSFNTMIKRAAEEGAQFHFTNTTCIDSACSIRNEAISHGVNSSDLLKLQDKLDELTEKIDKITVEKKYSPSQLLSSCEEMKQGCTDCPSDYYVISDSHGHTRHVYCNMDDSLCGSEGWMRVAYLNMTDEEEYCPGNFYEYDIGGIRACGRHSSPSGAHCVSTKFSAYDVSYREVCGRVNGYQYGSPDALASNLNNINTHYVDGVSITKGSPRVHIWTFMAALQENSFYTNGRYVCPCAPNSPVNVPSFIGNDYFCESGCPGSWHHGVLYSDDLLWDGKDCGNIEQSCCGDSPWFHKSFTGTSTDYLELRVCGDQSTADEDSPISFVDIYVR